MKKYITILLAVILSLSIFTGCSEKASVEKATQTTTVKEASKETQVDTDNKLTPPEDDHIYIEKGQSVSDYFKYSLADYGAPDEYSEDGYNGLEYTFDNVKVYKSVSDSPIPTNKCEKVFGSKADTKLYQSNSFILIDMTAKYNKPKNSDRNKIMFRMEFEGIYMSGEGYRKYQSKDFHKPYISPMVVYFSQRPQKGDLDLNGKELNLEHDGNVCRKALNSGDSLKFQIGILTKKDLVDEKNVFLYLRKSETPEKGNPVPLVDVLGRFES